MDKTIEQQPRAEGGRMMETKIPEVKNYGLYAEHDAACPVFWKEGKPAVFDCNAGVFRPSWRAQERGWRLVEARTRIQRLALRLFFSEKM